MERHSIGILLATSLAAVMAAPSAVGSGDCRCQSSMACCRTTSVPVSCGPTTRPWEWSDYGEVQIIVPCDEGWQDLIIAMMPNDQFCRYREGKCLDKFWGICRYGPWVVMNCPWDDIIALFGEECP